MSFNINDVTQRDLNYNAMSTKAVNPPSRAHSRGPSTLGSPCFGRDDQLLETENTGEKPIKETGTQICARLRHSPHRTFKMSPNTNPRPSSHVLLVEPWSTLFQIGFSRSHLKYGNSSAIKAELYKEMQTLQRIKTLRKLILRRITKRHVDMSHFSTYHHSQHFQGHYIRKASTPSSLDEMFCPIPMS